MFKIQPDFKQRVRSASGCGVDGHSKTRSVQFRFEPISEPNLATTTRQCKAEIGMVRSASGMRFERTYSEVWAARNEQDTKSWRFSALAFPFREVHVLIGTTAFSDSASERYRALNSSKSSYGGGRVKAEYYMHMHLATYVLYTVNLLEKQTWHGTRKERAQHNTLDTRKEERVTARHSGREAGRVLVAPAPCSTSHARSPGEPRRNTYRIAWVGQRRRMEISYCGSLAGGEERVCDRNTAGFELTDGLEA
ncbi:hypothetical protein DFH09DRAFT_1288619 [Mycena vulgaris]|nr:hypothetical protein DFH09DRAFT_1288619 [Mycena vulgaris]